MNSSFSVAPAIVYSFNLCNMSKSIVRQRVVNSNLLEYASKNRDEGFFNDVIIKAGTESIPANRLVLSCHSKYFEGMFKFSILKDDYVIEMGDFDGATIRALIDFIYCGSININDQNVMKLQSGADYLQLEEVQCFCFEFLEAKEIELGNSLDIFKMVSKHEGSTLHKKVKKYISYNINKISETEKFKLLSKENLISCISSLDRLHANEASIYQAVVTWTRHNKEARTPEFPELFKMINLNYMAVDFLEKIILEENLVANNPQCRKEAFAAYKQLTLEQTDQSRANETHLISLGGNSAHQNVTVVFSLSQETSKNYPKFDKAILVYCCLKLNDYIYVIGIQQNIVIQQVIVRPADTNVVLKLNLKEQNGKWKQVTSFNKDRFFLCASVFRGTIFVAGGYHKAPLSGTIFVAGRSLKAPVSALSDYYDPSKNKWKSGPRLRQSRCNHCLVTCDGWLYALGGLGEGEGEVLSSVEMLKQLKGTWQKIQPMRTTRCLFAAVNCNGEVYAIGGYGKNFFSECSECLKSVEKYDFDANRWKYVAAMNIRRKKHAACVLRGKIYVVGGVGTDEKAVKEIECYDPATDKWSIVETVTDDLIDHKLVAV